MSLISEFILAPKTCLRFYYHMFGDRLGTLNVKLKLRNGKLETLWTKAKNQLDYWRMGHTSIDQDMGYQVRAIHCVKSARIRGFSGPYFPTFGLNTENSVSLRIQSKCEKIRTRKTPNTDTFLAVIVIRKEYRSHWSLFQK